MRTSISNGKSIDRYIPPHLRDVFYRNPNRKYARHNGLDPYGFSTNGLVLYLPLWALKDSSFKSVDAYQHTATITSSVTWGPTGRYFAGSNDYITVPHHAALASTSAYSYVVWARMDDTTTGGHNGALLTKTANADDPGSGYALRNYEDDLYYYYFDTDGTRRLGVKPASIAADTWYHIAFTNNGTAALGYLDTALSTFTAPTGIKQDTADFVLGELAGFGDFKGYVGEIREYNRVLAAGEITHDRNCTMFRYQ